MNVLFIGGTGNISTWSSRLAVARGIHLSLLNRGRRAVDIPGAEVIQADINDKQQIQAVLKCRRWDCVVNWIAFTPQHIARDIELFQGRCGQYIFISSASAYQKPPSHPVITESTPLANPYWDYSRDKIACEDALMQAYRASGFPVTIVRPSLTYDTVIPLVVGGWEDYTIIDRMQRGKPVVVPGDGTSLWTITHAEDFARGFVGLLGHPQAIGQSFHITSDELLTWDQIYQSASAAVGVEAKIVHVPSDLMIRVNPSLAGTLLGDKIHSAIFDNTKIKTFVPEYCATIPFHIGIRRTIQWYQADPKRMAVLESVNKMIDSILDQYRLAFPEA
jgi:nucleoside-diphosphate-sugar epimerase